MGIERRKTVKFANDVTRLSYEYEYADDKLGCWKTKSSTLPLKEVPVIEQAAKESITAIESFFQQEFYPILNQLIKEEIDAKVSSLKLQSFPEYVHLPSTSLTHTSAIKQLLGISKENNYDMVAQASENLSPRFQFISQDKWEASLRQYLEQIIKAPHNQKEINNYFAEVKATTKRARNFISWVNQQHLISSVLIGKYKLSKNSGEFKSAKSYIEGKLIETLASYGKDNSPPVWKTYSKGIKNNIRDWADIFLYKYQEKVSPAILASEPIKPGLTAGEETSAYKDTALEKREEDLHEKEAMSSAAISAPRVAKESLQPHTLLDDNKQALTDVTDYLNSIEKTYPYVKSLVADTCKRNLGKVFSESKQLDPTKISDLISKAELFEEKLHASLNTLRVISNGKSINFLEMISAFYPEIRTRILLTARVECQKKLGSYLKGELDNEGFNKFLNLVNELVQEAFEFEFLGVIIVELDAEVRAQQNKIAQLKKEIPDNFLQKTPEVENYQKAINDLAMLRHYRKRALAFRKSEKTTKISWEARLERVGELFKQAESLKPVLNKKSLLYRVLEFLGIVKPKAEEVHPIQRLHHSYTLYQQYCRPEASDNPAPPPVSPTISIAAS